MYLLDYILPQVAKLSRALQTKHMALSLISNQVDATLNSLDDAILPSANWVLQSQDAREELRGGGGGGGGGGGEYTIFVGKKFFSIS